MQLITIKYFNRMIALVFYIIFTKQNPNMYPLHGYVIMYISHMSSGKYIFSIFLISFANFFEIFPKCAHFNVN